RPALLKAPPEDVGKTRGPGPLLLKGGLADACSSVGVPAATAPGPPMCPVRRCAPRDPTPGRGLGADDRPEIRKRRTGVASTLRDVSGLDPVTVGTERHDWRKGVGLPP